MRWFSAVARTIVLCDADCDPDFEFADLANAVRKIRIDMGIEITFPEPGLDMTPRPDPDATPPARPRHAIYWAQGEIHYPETAKPGELLYIKPCYYGEEAVTSRRTCAALPSRIRISRMRAPRTSGSPSPNSRVIVSWASTSPIWLDRLLNRSCDGRGACDWRRKCNVPSLFPIIYIMR